MPLTLSAEDSLARLDLSFKLAKLSGRVAWQFRKQALELIGICREMNKHCKDQETYSAFLQVVATVDKAIMKCIEYEHNRNKDSGEEAQRYIGAAISCIQENSNLHPTSAELWERFQDAKTFDESHRAKYVKLKERELAEDFKRWSESEQKKVPMIFRSVFWNRYQEVYQIYETPRTLRVHPKSDFEEVLFLFSRNGFGGARLSLRDNAQFYFTSLTRQKQPKQSEQPKQQEQPTQPKQQEQQEQEKVEVAVFPELDNLPLDPLPAPGDHKEFLVLLDHKTHILLDCETPKLFGGAWPLKGDRVLLKEFSGRLLNDTTLAEEIKAHKFIAASSSQSTLPSGNSSVVSLKAALREALVSRSRNFTIKAEKLPPTMPTPMVHDNNTSPDEANNAQQKNHALELQKPSKPVPVHMPEPSVAPLPALSNFAQSTDPNMPPPGVKTVSDNPIDDAPYTAVDYGDGHAMTKEERIIMPMPDLSVAGAATSSNSSGAPPMPKASAYLYYSRQGQGVAISMPVPSISSASNPTPRQSATPSIPSSDPSTSKRVLQHRNETAGTRFNRASPSPAAGSVGTAAQALMAPPSISRAAATKEYLSTPAKQLAPAHALKRAAESGRHPTVRAGFVLHQPQQTLLPPPLQPAAQSVISAVPIDKASTPPPTFVSRSLPDQLAAPTVARVSGENSDGGSPPSATRDSTRDATAAAMGQGPTVAIPEATPAPAPVNGKAAAPPAGHLVENKEPNGDSGSATDKAAPAEPPARQGWWGWAASWIR